MVTKSGTNQYHGSAFWSARNTDLNRAKLLLPRTGLLKRNQTGFTAGGPVLKNKFFAFGGLEKLWLRQAPGDLKLTSRRLNGAAIFRRWCDDLRPDDRLAFPRTTSFPKTGCLPPRMSWLITPLPDPDGFARFSYPLPEDDWQYIFRWIM